MHVYSGYFGVRSLWRSGLGIQRSTACGMTSWLRWSVLARSSQLHSYIYRHSSPRGLYDLSSLLTVTSARWPLQWRGRTRPPKKEKAQHTEKKENKPRRGKTNRRKGEASAEGEKKKKDVSLIRCCPCCCCPCFGSVCRVCTVSVRISQSNHHQGFPHSLFQTSGAADVSRVPGKEGWTSGSPYRKCCLFVRAPFEVFCCLDHQIESVVRVHLPFRFQKAYICYTYNNDF